MSASPLGCHSGKAGHNQERGSQPVFSSVRNSGGWDGCCGSQSSVHPDAAGDLEELRRVV